MTKKFITVSIRVPADIVEAIDALALEASRDRSKQIMHMLRKALQSGE